MIKKRKRYSKPEKLFEKTRIEKENGLLLSYGLKNKKEIWKAKGKAERIRKEAAKLLTTTTQEQENFLSRLKKLGIIEENAKIDDALAINEESILKRRLQTIVFKKGMAKTAREARQLIVHGHISIGERAVDIPSYLVSKVEEGKIQKIFKEKTKKQEKIKTQEAQPSENKIVEEEK